MKPRSLRQIVVLAVLASATLGCSVTTFDPPGPTARSTPTPSPIKTSEPSPTPVPTLPALLVDPAGILQWCTNWDGLDAAVIPLYCTEAIEAAIRSMGPLQGSIVQADAFYHPICPVPDACGPASPDRMFVVLLSRAAGPLVVRVDRAADQEVLVSPPQPGPAPSPAPDFDPPPVQRPDFPNAPQAFRNREPYPFCGRRQQFVDGDDFGRCFVLAVRSGTPAELIEDGFSVEGDPFTVVYRFSGAGAVAKWHDSTRDPLSDRQWHVRPCVMYRSEDPFSFGCD